jgi:hypothetical protein
LSARRRCCPTAQAAAIAGFPGSGRKYPQGNGCPTGTTVVYLATADTSPWTVPSCWNNSNNKIEVIGAGGGGGALDVSLLGKHATNSKENKIVFLFTCFL